MLTSQEMRTVINTLWECLEMRGEQVLIFTTEEKRFRVQIVKEGFLTMGRSLFLF